MLKIKLVDIKTVNHKSMYHCSWSNWISERYVSIGVYTLIWTTCKQEHFTSMLSKTIALKKKWIREVKYQKLTFVYNNEHSAKMPAFHHSGLCLTEGHVSSCGIRSGQTGTWTVFSEYLSFPRMWMCMHAHMQACTNIHSFPIHYPFYHRCYTYSWLWQCH
jgi:hypothetical protein